MEQGCPFCKRDEERIITETDDAFIIATLGQIVGGYALLIPKQHISCIGAYDAYEGRWNLLSLGERLSTALRIEYTAKPVLNHSVTVFEHGIVGQTVKHAHLHFIPASIDFTQRICEDFPDSEIETLRYAIDIGTRYNERQEPYLLWTVPDGCRVCWNPPAPPQYLRIVAADLLGHPERANWRNMDPELDKKLWSETVARLKPYFL